MSVMRYNLSNKIELGMIKMKRALRLQYYETGGEQEPEDLFV